MAGLSQDPGRFGVKTSETGLCSISGRFAPGEHLDHTGVIWTMNGIRPGSDLDALRCFSCAMGTQQALPAHPGGHAALSGANISQRTFVVFRMKLCSKHKITISADRACATRAPGALAEAPDVHMSQAPDITGLSGCA